MKTIDKEIYADLLDTMQTMKLVLNEVLARTRESKDADTAANVAGKGLKAHQLYLAKEIFMDMVEQRVEDRELRQLVAPQIVPPLEFVA